MDSTAAAGETVRGSERRQVVFERDGHTCFVCDRKILNVSGDQHSQFKSYQIGTVDHIIPFSVCKTNGRWNLIPMCARCNLYKADSVIVDYLELVKERFAEHVIVCEDSSDSDTVTLWLRKFPWSSPVESWYEFFELHGVHIITLDALRKKIKEHTKL